MNCNSPSVFRTVLVVSLVVAGLARADLVETNPPSAAAVSTSAPATAAALTNAEPGTLGALFNRDLPDAIGRSKIHFEWRPRYEYADTETAKPSDAFTMRTVFGLTTAEIYGFQGMIEGLNVLSVGNSDNYYAGNNPSASDKALVLDPPTTEINQAWVGYTYTNWATSGKGGRQTINLDNQRFIGSVDWRQNPQTFDAIRLGNTSVEKLDLLYTWIGRVNRVGGNVPDLLPGAKDYQSSSHVLHAHYESSDYADLTGYIYLLDLENGVGSAASCATYGFSVVGTAPLAEERKLDYRGEFAWQTDYADNPNNYSAPYLHLTLGSRIQPVSFGVGYELLGSDNNVGFQTPLATLHAFNGWADVFLNTPASGLQDLYVWGQVDLPWDLPLKVTLHKFDAASDGLSNYGNEMDVSLSRKLGKHWTALVKYAFYNAVNAAPGAQNVPANVQKFWVQVDFKL